MCLKSKENALVLVRRFSGSVKFREVPLTAPLMVVTRFTDHRRRVHSAGPRIDNAAPASTVYTHVKSVAVMLG